MTFAILICILPFLLLPPSHGISSQKPRYCWREIYFCSCNLYNWNSWEVTNHFFPHLFLVRDLCFLLLLSEMAALLPPKAYRLTVSPPGREAYLANSSLSSVLKLICILIPWHSGISPQTGRLDFYKFSHPRVPVQVFTIQYPHPTLWGVGVGPVCQLPWI